MFYTSQKTAAVCRLYLLVHFFKYISCGLIQISLEFVPKCLMTKCQHWVSSWFDACEATSHNINGLVHNYSISTANTLEILQSCHQQKPMLSSAFWTHWGRVTHICISKLTIIGSDNDLSPGRRQAIIWTNAGIYLIGPSGTNFSEILIKLYIFSFKKMHLKMSRNWRPFCLGLNVLTEMPSVLFWAGQCSFGVPCLDITIQDKFSWFR